ncbi:DUF1353 domain-containing protein [Marinobacter fonticola]|uniref:DUF1353 domain-containing protein n=1 Tax=Marinobacter fonticola TaxID=2603215 RepID=UPI0011E6F2DE|nr:DUF1353 domain-containing protein [Marinobacter fonticola]
MPFVGDVETRWIVESGLDRKMELLAPFAFIDGEGRTWPAEAGDTINGASLPEAIWSRIAGTPFVGDYRRASVVHDVAIDKHIRSSREAHRMFYEAMLEDGVDRRRALLFYMAVRAFGPQWRAGEAPESFDPLNPNDPDFDVVEAAFDHALSEE